MKQIKLNVFINENTFQIKNTFYTDNRNGISLLKSSKMLT